MYVTEKWDLETTWSECLSAGQLLFVFIFYKIIHRLGCWTIKVTFISFECCYSGHIIYVFLPRKVLWGNTVSFVLFFSSLNNMNYYWVFKMLTGCFGGCWLSQLCITISSDTRGWCSNVLNSVMCVKYVLKTVGLHHSDSFLQLRHPLPLPGRESHCQLL